MHGTDNGLIVVVRNRQRCYNIIVDTNATIKATKYNNKIIKSHGVGYDRVWYKNNSKKKKTKKESEIIEDGKKQKERK